MADKDRHCFFDDPIPLPMAASCARCKVPRRGLGRAAAVRCAIHVRYATTGLMKIPSLSCRTISSPRNERAPRLGLNYPAANTLFGSSVFNAFCDTVTATGGLRPPNRGLRETDGPSAERRLGPF